MYLTIDETIAFYYYAKVKQTSRVNSDLSQLMKI